MRSIRRWGALWLIPIAAGLSGLDVTARSGQDVPDAAGFLRQVRAAIRLDYELQRQFTYVERRRDVRVSKLGKLEVGPERTFEVFPSSIPGRTYKRLIAVDGQPLSADELAERDRTHQDHLADRAARVARETPDERAERLREEATSEREREAIVDDGFAVFAIDVVGRERLDGEPVLVVSLTPRDTARVTTREGRWMKQFEGRAWIAEADHQIARLEMHARDDVSIGWGILGRVHEGSRFVFSRRRFQDVWLPAEVIYDATGRTLLFRTFDIDLVTTYSRYKRIQ